MTDDNTTIKPKRISHWASALKEYNSTRIAGSKFLFPKKDTEEYFKVKEISDKLKKNLTVVIPDTASEPVVKARKPRVKKEVKEEIV